MVINGKTVGLSVVNNLEVVGTGAKGRAVWLR